MSRHVAEITVCFQGFPIFAGGSTQHGLSQMLIFPWPEIGLTKRSPNVSEVHISLSVVA
jgi:hypothetical protein